MSISVAVLIGSFRKKAFSRSVAIAVADALPAGFAPFIPHLDKLPLFNQDFDDEDITPPEWLHFREQIAVADAVLVVTPEYNRSFPAVLKNAIDIASRPPGHNLWAGKPAAITSVSPGSLGGALSNQHIRQPLTFVGLHIMPSPELYVGNAGSLLDASGMIVDENTLAHIQKFASAFAEWSKGFVKQN
jgi:chromate reductase